MKIQDVLQHLAEVDRQQRESAHLLITGVFESLNRDLNQALSQAWVGQMTALREALESSRAKVVLFRAALGRSDPNRITEAVMAELQRAKPPNGKVLWAVISRGGVFTSAAHPHRPYNLPETFIQALTTPEGQGDITAAYTELLRDLRTRLEGIQPPLPRDLRVLTTEQLQNAMRRMNAVLTVGSDLRLLLQRALVWRGGKGASDAAIAHARRVLADDTRGTKAVIPQITEFLASGVEGLLQLIEESVERRLTPERESMVVRPLLPPSELRVCIVCLRAPAVGRAAFAQCACAPKMPYACADCLHLHLFRACPICRGR